MLYEHLTIHRISLDSFVFLFVFKLPITTIHTFEPPIQHLENYKKNLTLRNLNKFECYNTIRNAYNMNNLFF